MNNSAPTRTKFLAQIVEGLQLRVYNATVRVTTSYYSSLNAKVCMHVLSRRMILLQTFSVMSRVLVDQTLKLLQSSVKERMIDVLFSGAPITTTSSIVLILSFVMKHKLSQEAFRDLLAVIEARSLPQTQQLQEGSQETFRACEPSEREYC